MQLVRTQSSAPKSKEARKGYLQLLQLLLEGVVQQVAVAGARECSSVLWACAKLESPPSRMEVGVVWERFWEVVQGEGRGIPDERLHAEEHCEAGLIREERKSRERSSSSKEQDGDVEKASSSRQSNSGGSRSGNRGSSFTSQDLSLAFWAVATLQWQISGEQLDTLLAVAADQGVLATAAPQAVANILWAVATLQHEPSSRVMLLLESRASEVLLELNHQGLHNVLWGMTKLMWTPKQGFQGRFLEVTRGKLQAMPPHTSTGILWCWATLGLGMPREWLREWHEASLLNMLPLQQQQQKQWQQQRGQPGRVMQGQQPGQQELEEQQGGPLPMIKEHNVQLAQHHQQRQPRQQQQLQGFGPQDFGNALWAHGNRGWQPSDTWMAGFWEGSRSQLEHAGVQELANMLWAAAKLRRRPDREWVRLWLSCMVRRMDR